MMQSLQQKNVSCTLPERDRSTSVKEFSKQRFLPNLLVELCMLSAFIGFSQQASAQLATGDLAFTSFNADEDGWSLVTFADLPANTIVYFTDNEAISLTVFNTGESYFQWTTGADIIVAATVIRFNNIDNATTLGASAGTLSRLTVSGSANYGLSTGAETLYAYLANSGTPSAPVTFLAAITNDETAQGVTDLTNAGLVNGTNALILTSAASGPDYGEYNGSRSGQTTFAAYRPLVNNLANWAVDAIDGTYTTTVPNTTAFSIVAVTSTVNLSVSPNSGSEAGITAMTVTANASAAVSGDQTVQLTVSGTGITAGDYSLPNTTITIPSGGTSGAVTFTVTDDVLFEGDETAILTISNPSAGITLGVTSEQNIIITDNDAAPPAVDLSSYVRIGRYDLPEPTRTTSPANSLLAQEVSAVTYNWDTQTLFVVGDGGTSVVQVTKTGQLINSMTLAPGSSPQGTEFYDPEGLTYRGNGQFVMSEERDRQVVLFTYVAGTTLTRSATQTVKLGTFVQNIGIEGLTYDPLTNGYICVKEIQPEGIFQTNIDFNAGTATNGSATTENSINLFDPALTGLSDFADVFALSNLPSLSGQSNYGNLLVLSQENAKIVNIDRSGNISSSLTIVSDPGNPLTVAAQQHEGLTMDRDGILYVVSENGGGDFDHPQLWVYAPSLVPNQAPTAITLTNTVNSIEENTSTTSAVKVADIVVTDDGLGTNNLTLSGADAGFFEITGTALFIKAGTVLDYETKTSYNVTVNVDDAVIGNTPDATTDLVLNITDVVIETPGSSPLIISEVAPWSSGNSPGVAADWFEVTNTGTSAVDITGWKMDDNSNAFASSVALSGITSIAAGESVIFIETNDLPGKTAAFLSTWFGANAPVGLRIGNYTGSGVGLSTSGDAVNLYNAAGVLQANVSFGTSPANSPFATFNNAAGLNNAPVTTLSQVGVNDAFVAVNDANEIGSPGTIGKLFISEVAPWSSGNSPVAADWFELTNTRATAVDITGWKMDDNSGSPAAAVPLAGITSIAPGESVIFIETSDLPGKTAAFISNWFGATPPAGLRIGNYTGTGVGLSTGGDAVNLYNATGTLQASVIFGTSPAGPSFPTFDNAAGLNNTTISQLSVTGVNGAFVAVNSANEIGSPGNKTPVCVPTSSTEDTTACSSYTWNGTEYTTSGTYTFTTQNAAGCDSIATLHLTVNQPTTGDTTAIACSSFNWYGTEYTQSGTATHILTNAAGCDSTLTLHLTINQPTSSTESVTACGSYTWNETEYANSGTYTFNTTNAAGCDSVATLILTINPVPVATANAGSIICNGGTTTVVISANGGTSPYTGTGNFTVAAGTYNYVVNDFNGCADTAHISVSEPAAIAYTVQSAPISCFGGTTTATIIATGGTAPYTYRINSKKAQASNTFNGLKAGSYLMTVMDASGCSTSSSFNITQPTKLKLLITEKNRPSCIGATNGSIVVNAVGSTGVYEYSFNNGGYSVNNTFANLAAGNYTITAKDANGCTAGGTVRLADNRVSCGSFAIEQIQTSVSGAKMGNAGLSIKVLPNPSTTNFTLILQSNSNENVQVRVSDMYGKKLYQAKGTVNQQYSFGNNFVNGMYIVQVIQGTNIQTLKLIKGKG
ncbi:hypothetical protein BH10BAC2_BH10BAC2_11120 [soil metagenome]